MIPQKDVHFQQDELMCHGVHDSSSNLVYAFVEWDGVWACGLFAFRDK